MVLSGALIPAQPIAWESLQQYLFWVVDFFVPHEVLYNMCLEVFQFWARDSGQRSPSILGGSGELCTVHRSPGSRDHAMAPVFAVVLLLWVMQTMLVKGVGFWCSFRQRYRSVLWPLVNSVFGGSR